MSDSVRQTKWTLYDLSFLLFSHLAWVQTDRKSGGLDDLKNPLVSDVIKSISKSYIVLIPDQGIALRGLFIIDKEGASQHSTINNLAISRSVDETLRTLQIFILYPSFGALGCLVWDLSSWINHTPFKAVLEGLW